MGHVLRYRKLLEGCPQKGNKGLNMKHAHPVTKRRPLPAQFEPLLQIVGLASAVLSLIENVARVFGLDLPQKSE